MIRSLVASLLALASVLGLARPVHAQAVPVTFAADVFFDFDRSELKPEACRKLDLLVLQLQGLQLEAVHVVGHTDSKASDGYNQHLSASRSAAVRQYLIARGLPAGRVQIAGRGEAQPADDNRTRHGRLHNRRVEIEVIGLRPRSSGPSRPSP
jgi:OOP family OmpA-OmpF porin